MDVFDAMSLWVFYRYKSMLWCLSLSMDLQAMSINVYGFAGLVYGCYKKGRNLWCYWCYVDYIHLDSYIFFSWCISEFSAHRKSPVRSIIGSRHWQFGAVTSRSSLRVHRKPPFRAHSSLFISIMSNIVDFFSIGRDHWQDVEGSHQGVKESAGSWRNQPQV